MAGIYTYMLMFGIQYFSDDLPKVKVISALSFLARLSPIMAAGPPFSQIFPRPFARPGNKGPYASDLHIKIIGMTFPKLKSSQLFVSGLGCPQV